MGTIKSSIKDRNDLLPLFYFLPLSGLFAVLTSNIYLVLTAALICSLFLGCASLSSAIGNVYWALATGFSLLALGTAVVALHPPGWAGIISLGIISVAIFVLTLATYTDLAPKEPRERSRMLETFARRSSHNWRERLLLEFCITLVALVFSRFCAQLNMWECGIECVACLFASFLAIQPREFIRYKFFGMVLVFSVILVCFTFPAILVPPCSHSSSLLMISVILGQLNLVKIFG